MAGFTDDEVRASIDRFLFKQVEMSITKTGSRDIRAARDVIYDLITSSLLVRPDSFFYVVWLATNKLQALLQQQIVAMDIIAEAGPGVSRPSKVVTSTTELSNAQAALLDINSGLGTRTQGVNGSIGPGVNRFRRSVSRFVSSELTKNTVVNGTVTETGDELKAKIAATWSQAIDRHAQIQTLTSNISSALEQLSAAALPQSAIQSIVQRIQGRLKELQTLMGSTQAVQQSREAMLDLLTMRTLMAKASSFRGPVLSLAPLTGDATTVTLVNGPGAEASIEGTISAPYNYDPGTSIDLSINSGASTPTVPLPSHSRAEVRSRVFFPWVLNAGGEIAAFRVDLGPTLASGVAPVFASGPIAVAFLAPFFAPTVLVTWDAGANQIVFQSVNNTDISDLRALSDTAPRTAFVSWAFNGGASEARGVPPAAASVAQAFSTVPLIDPKIDETFYPTSTGIRTATIGEEAFFQTVKDSDTNLIADGTNVVSSPTKNFAALGVRVGMGIKITAPGPSVGDYAILAVNGPALTLSATVAATLVGVYRIGDDYRSVPDDARVRITSRTNRDNTGFYRVAAGGGQIARLVLDRNIPDVDSSLTASPFTQYLRLSSRGTTVTSGIGAVASLGATALGFAATPEVRPTLSIFVLTGSGDFLFRGVRSGDLVTLTSPGLLLYSRIVDSASTDQFTVTQSVPYEAGNWTYQISSARVSSYLVLESAAEDLLATQYFTKFETLDSLIGRLIRGALFAGPVSAAVAQYRLDLSSMLAASIVYTVPRETTIDNVVQTLREQGFDRAIDLFLSLAIQLFFSMDADGVSYSTWLVNRSSAVATQVVPVSKFGKSYIIHQEWRPISFQAVPLDPLGSDLNRR